MMAMAGLVTRQIRTSCRQATTMTHQEQICPELPCLKTIPHAPLAIVHLGFPREAINHSLNGFGVLVSNARSMHTLGVLFSSTIFPGRAPKDQVLLTVFLGGIRNRSMLLNSEIRMRQIALADIKGMLGVSTAPLFHRVTCWPAAIPQYDINHETVLKDCHATEKTFPKLHLLGNYRGGISLASCLSKARKCAKQIQASIAQLGPQQVFGFYQA